MNRSSDHVRDDDLAEPLTRAQQRHVDSCSDCAHRRSTILAVQEAVRALPRTAEPPAAALALLEDPAPARWRHWWRSRRRRVLLGAAVLGAAVVAVVLVLGIRARHRTPMDDDLAQEIALDHLHYERNPGAAEVSGGADRIGDYFAQTLDRRPHITPLEAATLVGGKRCRIGGEWSALIWLERAGHWLSLFSMPQDAVARRGCVHASGVNVCGIPDPHGGSRVLAGNLPDSEMLRLLDESVE